MSDWNYYQDDPMLRDLGITSTRLDYTDLIEPETQIRESKVAYCSSPTCYKKRVAQNKHMYQSKLGAQKDVAPSAQFCPDCGWDLYWD